ncbi:MAG TPA: hypothetical protein IAB47_00885 [Candidatus Scatomorpha merdigallinarum]|nr:hypothetical protein [Candidatus Scatomorpha merdigallinarum]
MKSKDLDKASENILSEYGEQIARRSQSCGSFPARREARRILREMERVLAAREESDEGAWRWICDNRYLVEREARCAAMDFSLREQLRAGGRDALVCEAARELVARLGGDVDENEASAYFEGYQSVTPLTMRELELLPAAIKAGLVEIIAGETLSGSPSEGIVSAAISSLRHFATADMTRFIEGADLVSRTFELDPAGAYADMDERSRALYRRRNARLARREGMSELDCARRALELARAHEGDERRSHVGWWIFVEPLGRPGHTSSGALYALAVAVLSAALGVALGYISGGVWTALLTLLPASELIKNAIDAILLRKLPARLLPRMELAQGVPESARTVLAVSAVLASPKDGEKLARRLETFSFAARDCGKNLSFALLCDLVEAGSEHTDADAAAVAQAQRAVDGLNEKYGGGFYLFTRPRRENKRDGIWTPHERKRGALMALAALCSGHYSELECRSGDLSALEGTKYILALDADTTLLPGAARELIGAMAHPLNRARVEPSLRRVTEGRGIIHPRVSVELAASESTHFSRVAAGPGGMDAYGSACGEVWMDLTGCGGFAGKGIIDIAALLECCSDLPEGLILSHDAIEGALLHGGYMSDTELTDGFPSTPFAYFKRQHRWVRGDWQNLAVLAKLRGRLARADKLKLIDSARRSLAAPAACVAIALAALLPRAGLLPAAIVALLSLCSGLVSSLWRTLTRRSGREKHPGGALYGAALRAGQVVLKLLFLPWETWINLSAACAGLWRALCSHRRCLQWNTSAQTGSGSLKALLVSAWMQITLGAALLIFSPEPFGKTLGIVWLCGLPFTAALGTGLTSRAVLSEENRDFLLGECAKIWQYFDDMCTPERGYLPPDNFQEQPPVGVAERTSPTNIGLALVSALAAADLGLAGRERAFEIISGMLSTCEALPKWRGHLYNWYDTRTLSPLVPQYVSTVDSGNLAASLVVLAAGAREYGHNDLAGRASALARGMDFTALYDSDRRLFRIGFDASAGKLGEGCYDLLASEARLTGYYAVASGCVPARHWRALSRALVGRDGYRGLASWTGTMFEYLMPELYLPLMRGSLLWESARFCLYVQRKCIPHVAPWGQSESAYFALDATLSYRYKANGCAALALQRGMDEDTVCAPYAAYLALCVAPNAAANNLRRFAGRDSGGRYGLWESIDFTPRRCASPGGEVVRCVMAHHLGMSLISAANCLDGGVMRRRFMSDPAMAAFAPLLGERAPEGTPTLRRRAIERPERASERRGAVASDAGECHPNSTPRVFALSNGVYSLLMTSTGLSRASAGAVSIYRGFDNAIHGPAGFAVRLECQGGGCDLLPLPGGEGKLDFTYRLQGGLLRFEGRGADFDCAVTSGVSARDTSEVRIVELTARREIAGELVIEFEPTLAKAGDYAAHPAYWRLGMCAGLEGSALLIRRLPRQDAPGCWLCVASDAPVEVRANATGEELGWLSHPHVTARAAVKLAAGESCTCRFAVAFGAERKLALEAAQRALRCGAGQIADLTSALGAVYGLDAKELAVLPELAGRLLFARADGGGARLEELWASGISGDYPIAVSGAKPGSEDKIASIAARHALLRMCGVRADLAFITDDAADYHQKAAATVRRALSDRGLDALLGERAGIHCVASDASGAVELSAAVKLDEDGKMEARRFPDFAAAGPLARPRRGGRVDVAQREGEFSFTVRGALPERAWTLPMSNGKFGYLAADCGLGGMWTDNARERRINAWVCDERASSGPETLECNGHSLFAAEDGVECRVTYGRGWARWEKLGASVTAFVPLDAAARVLIVDKAPGEVRWHTALTLASEERDACFVVTKSESGLLCAGNVRSGMEFAAAFSCEALAYTCDEAAWSSGKPGGETGAGLMPCFGVVLPESECLVIACGACDADTLRELARPETAKRELDRVRAHFDSFCTRVRVSTPYPELDAYVNGWAVYQSYVGRMLARASLYQSGGAFGFRDQLQDAVNLLATEPSLARERIIDACAHQYAEGDVMHWWHRGRPDKGVRTRISDDLIWLPWAVCEYMDATGDGGILDQKVAGIVSAPLAPGEDSRYESAEGYGQSESVLAHAASALGCVLRRGFGPHGLLLMGTGDWCDGFDAVGSEGKGESVWLSEFFAHTAGRFAALLEARGDTPGAAALMSAVRRCVKGVERAWDGEWYRRGYFDDGAPLGSKESGGCQIDAIAQAWAAFAGCDRERVRTALKSAVERLFDREHAVTELFTPPFGDGTRYAGYVNSYGPGFRENGGQYTHGAIWLALACLESGLKDEGREILLALLHRGENYGAEPFVLAADVYSNPSRQGEAGWSWYTGSAGWFYRTALRFVEAGGVDGKFTKILPGQEL